MQINAFYSCAFQIRTKNKYSNLFCIETKTVKKNLRRARGGRPALREGADFPPLNGVNFLGRLSAKLFLVLFPKKYKKEKAKNNPNYCKSPQAT
jgi:hypothetical protein